MVSQGCKSERGPKKRLLTRDALDGRTRAARAFDAIAGGIAADLGGREHLTTVERELVEAFAGAAVNVRDVNARLLVGSQVDLVQQATAISSLCRLASRIGTGRRAKNVTPTLQQYLEAEAEPAEATE
jgi:hypothetical protein